MGRASPVPAGLCASCCIRRAELRWWCAQSSLTRPWLRFMCADRKTPSPDPSPCSQPAWMLNSVSFRMPPRKRMRRPTLLNPADKARCNEQCPC